MFSVDILNNSFILEFIAKSTIVMGLAYGLFILFKKNSPSLRYIILISAVYTVFLLPAFIYMDMKVDIEVDAPIFKEKKNTTEALANLKEDNFVIPDNNEKIVSTEPSGVVEKEVKEKQSKIWTFILSLSLNDYIFIAWLIPAAFLMIRFLLAYISILFIAGKARNISSQEQKIQMIDLCDEIGLNRYVKLLISKHSITPMTWGIFQPFVLLPKEAENWSEERLKYVLLHELAHIKRKDFFSNIITQIVTAVLWFNPLSWLIQKQLLMDREYACDNHVVENGNKASEYADHLLDIAKSIQKNHSTLISTLCMAKPSQLEGRLLSLLNNKTKAVNNFEKMLKVSLVVVLILPVIFINPIKASETVVKNDIAQKDFSKNELISKRESLPKHETKTVYGDSRSQAKAKETKKARRSSDNARRSYGSTAIREKTAAISTRISTSTLSAELAENRALNEFLANRNSNVNKKFSSNYRNYLVDHISDSLRLEDYIKLKRYGVTPEYISDLAELGFTDLTVNEIINFSKYGVSIPYIKKYKSMGLDNLRANDYVKMAKYGVTPQLVYDLRSIEKDLDIDEIIKASKYGLSKRFIREVGGAGFKDLSINELINMSKYGVSVNLIKALKNSGYKQMNASELVNAAKYGVSASFIKDIRSSGYKNISLNEMTRMAKYGVSSDLIKTLKREGYKNIDADDVTNAAKYGVSSNYIKEMNKAFSKKLSLRDLREFAKYGVSTSLIKSLRKQGYKNLDPDEVIRAAKYGLSGRFIEEIDKLGIDLKGDLDKAIDLSKYGFNKKVIKTLIDKNIIKSYDVSSMINLSKYGVNEDIVEDALESLEEMDINVNLDNIIDLAKYDISSDKIKMFRELGFKNASLTDIRKACMHGVNRSLIKKCKKNGFTNLNLEDYAKIAMHDPDFHMLPVLKSMGVKDVDSDDFVRLAIAGVNKRYLNKIKSFKPDEGWDVEMIIKLKHSGLDPEYIEKMRLKLNKN